jgi:hypothetical protein
MRRERGGSFNKEPGPVGRLVQLQRQAKDSGCDPGNDTMPVDGRRATALPAKGRHAVARHEA